MANSNPPTGLRRTWFTPVKMAVGLAWLLLALAVSGCNQQAGDTTQGGATADTSSTAQEQKVIWTCPMHAQVQQDAPGKCPICGMDLVKKS